MDTIETLRFVTVTGADDSIKPAGLIELSKQFPFVEWGILFSKKQQGGNRFPSIQWIDELWREKEEQNVDVNLSLHLCGQYVRDFLAGDETFSEALNYFTYQMFRRVQINTHGEPQSWNTSGIEKIIISSKGLKEYIFQVDGCEDNWKHQKEFARENDNVSLLLDTSHGAGILPGHWPYPPLSGVSTGYAGGLGPQNITEQLDRIISAINQMNFGADWWIDMETQVRSNQDQLFDLKKCHDVLRIVANVIG